MRPLTPFDRAWLAGLFEGEGTITITKNACMLVSVVSTDLDTVELFRAWWPMPLQRVNGKGNSRDAFVWRLTAGRAAEFLQELQRHFKTPRVRRKVEVALGWQARRSSKMPHTQEQRDADVQDIAYIRLLNRRGRVA